MTPGLKYFKTTETETLHIKIHKIIPKQFLMDLQIPEEEDSRMH